MNIKKILIKIWAKGSILIFILFGSIIFVIFFAFIALSLRVYSLGQTAQIGLCQEEMYKSLTNLCEARELYGEESELYLKLYGDPMPNSIKSVCADTIYDTDDDIENEYQHIKMSSSCETIRSTNSDLKENGNLNTQVLDGNEEIK